MKNKNYLIQLLLIYMTLISACGKSSPEQAGKEEGLKECDCAKLKLQADASMNAEKLSKLQQGIKDGTIKNQSDFPIADYKRNPESDSCWAELGRMQHQHELDFPKEDDRRTIRNASRSNLQDCRDNGTHQELLKEVMDSRAEFDATFSKLPY